ncbi:MAG: Uma2 family endonuclease, partial [Defluviitaleaceae bacterium]|nr:Uma2 family endonuclease [Defluviitaleaceae bacterium]
MSSATKKTHPEKGKYYTYADYETWDDDFRCELIDGVIYDMASPSRAHQEVSAALLTELHIFLRGKKCKVFHAPFDVRLNAATKDDIVVQPDILVICDEKKIENGKHCIGAPDFVVEILSPSTSRKDKIIKSRRYFDAGVKEYWLIDPEDRTVTTLKRSENCFTYLSYGDDAQ